MAVTSVPPVIAFWLLIALWTKLPSATPYKQKVNSRPEESSKATWALPQNVCACERSFISDKNVFAEILVVSAILQVCG